MKRVKPTKLQLYSFIASMPIIDFLLNYIMYDEKIFHFINIWLISFPLIFIIGIFSWRTHVYISGFIRMKYPELKHSGLRIMLLAFCIVPFMSGCIVFIFLLYDLFHIVGYQFSY